MSARFDSPVGPLTLVASRIGLRAILWPDDDRSIINGLPPPADDATLRRTQSQLTEYFDGGRTGFDLPLDPVGTAFQKSVWEVLRTIPYGDTMTYGEIAVRIGRPDASRAVGAANGRNPVSIVVPCHRVIGSDGSLTGFAGGVETKAFLLGLEQGVRTLW